MKNILPLSCLSPGSAAVVRSLDMEGKLRRRIMDLGLVEGTEIKVLQKSLSGDPMAYLIRGAVIALRSDITSRILVDTL